MFQSPNFIGEKQMFKLFKKFQRNDPFIKGYKVNRFTIVIIQRSRYRRFLLINNRKFIE